jgi:glucose/arabinose dehydrogenase
LPDRDIWEIAMLRALLAALTLAAACPAAAAQQSAAPAAPPAAPLARPPMMGGYSPADGANPDVAKAKGLAVAAVMKDLSTPTAVKSISAEQQVVAGTNYKVHVTLSTGDTYDVVVFRDLKGAMSVTSVKKAP